MRKSKTLRGGMPGVPSAAQQSSVPPLPQTPMLPPAGSAPSPVGMPPLPKGDPKGKKAKGDADCAPGKRMGKGDPDDWIAGAVKNKGALRSKLGAKPGKGIPAAKLAKAEKAPGKLGKEANLAKTLKSFRK